MILYFKTSRSSDHFGETDFLLDEQMVVNSGNIPTYASADGHLCKAVVSLAAGEATVTLDDGEVCPVLALATDRYAPALAERFCDVPAPERDGHEGDTLRLIMAYVLDRLADALGLDDEEGVVDRHFHRSAEPVRVHSETLDDECDVYFENDVEAEFGACCEVVLSGHLIVVAGDTGDAADKAVRAVEENLDEEIYTDELSLSCDGVRVAEVTDLGGGRFDVRMYLECCGEVCVSAADEDDAQGKAGDIIAFETSGLCVQVGCVSFKVESTSVTDVMWV